MKIDSLGIKSKYVKGGGVPSRVNQWGREKIRVKSYGVVKNVLWKNTRERFCKRSRLVNFQAKLVGRTFQRKFTHWASVTICLNFVSNRQHTIHFLKWVKLESVGADVWKKCKVFSRKFEDAKEGLDLSELKVEISI